MSGQSRELQPHRPPEGITESDYEAIEDAVMETARGRWFLKEYARRMRAAETASLRDALERIESMVARAQPAGAGARAPVNAGPRMENIAERLLDITWYMRERGIANSACAAIDKEARALTALASEMGGGAEMAPEAFEAAPAKRETPRRSEIIEGEACEAVPDIAAPPASVPEPPPPAEPDLTPVHAFEPAPQTEYVAAPHAIVADKAQDTASVSLAARLAAFVHIEAMPIRQRLALFA